MIPKIPVPHDSIARSLEAFRQQEGADHVQDVPHDDGPFHVGDDVATTCGHVAGVNVALNGNEALISWSYRGKSTETLDHLVHIPHEPAE